MFPGLSRKNLGRIDSVAARWNKLSDVGKIRSQGYFTKLDVLSEEKMDKGG